MKTLVTSFLILMLAACSGSDGISEKKPASGFLGVYAERLEKDVLPLLRSPEMKVAKNDPAANARLYEKALKLYITTTDDVWMTADVEPKNEPCVIVFPSGGRNDQWSCYQAVGNYVLQIDGYFHDEGSHIERDEVDSRGNKIYSGDTVLLTATMRQPGARSKYCARSDAEWGWFSNEGYSSLNRSPSGNCNEGIYFQMSNFQAVSFDVVCEQKNCVTAELLKREKKTSS